MSHSTVSSDSHEPPLSHATLLQLKRWNTPTIANGWEQITDLAADAPVFNRQPTTDFMPEMGPMVGFAVTVVIQPSDGSRPQQNADAWSQYRRYVASCPGPKIVVVQDLDAPHPVGAFWGEVNSNMHRALGCVGTITSGAIRDLDEMKNAGFKALAQQLCVSHVYSHPIRWGGDVEVFGCHVSPGQLIHADKHGFFACPPGEESQLLDAARFMDQNECDTMIAAARAATGLSRDEMLVSFDDACRRFGEAARGRFARRGEFG